MNTVEEYLNGLSLEAREAIELIRECIKSHVPDADELLNYNILAFALVPGGKRDCQIMVAGYDKHIGFYPAPETIAQFSDEITEFKSAKGSVQFPLDRPMPLELISKMVEYKKGLLSKK